MSEAVVVYTTWPDAETAETFAAEAVAERLAACANILTPMRSIYRWQGAVDSATETPMLLKTSKGAAEALMALVLRRHPYEVPCVVGLPIRAEGSNPAFLQWILSEATGTVDPLEAEQPIHGPA
jgi:periplasmic divalent cation tolerance protein